MEKSIFKRLAIGFKKGWNTPTLPEDKLQLEKHPLVRILRVLGGLSVIVILGHAPFKTPMFIMLIAMCIVFFFGAYCIYMQYHRIKHIKFLIKSGQLDVKNSPMDR